MTSVVRPVLAGEEARQAGALVLAAYRALPGFEPDPGYEADLADVEGRLPPRAEVLVAVGGGGGLLGCVTFVPGPASPLAEGLQPGECGIRMLGVDPAAQGRGAGRALVEACVARGRALGCRRVALHSTTSMQTAHGLYASMGFERDAERDWAPYDGLLLLAFGLTLDPSGTV